MASYSAAECGRACARLAPGTEHTHGEHEGVFVTPGAEPATEQQLFTGRDVLAAENHLRCSTLKDAMRIIREMPDQVVIRLAAHVGASPSDLPQIVQRARMPYWVR